MIIQDRKFRREYDSLFKKEPLAANVMLLLCELADEKGIINFEINYPTDAEIKRLLLARFNDPYAYNLPGGVKK